MESSIQALLQAVSVPWVGLTSVGVMSFLAATLLPFSSEAVFFAYLIQFPENVWSLIAVASLGNILGGVVNWHIGYFAKNAKDSILHSKNIPTSKLSAYLRQLGSKSLLFSWLPIIGDPLTIFAGWSKLPFWPCCIYMLIGKTLRYLVIACIYLWSNNSLGTLFA
ncbi:MULTISPECIES: YqaA family protein [unclassified Polynucleobacter]|uniref:YqaA family protein n=1 Tax=unclassified Polynucleobacter TaxID=2640945 RepID=UPI00248FE3CB|nr:MULTISPECIES: YqaA family protein [unclassified Polynucleobacter]